MAAKTELNKNEYTQKMIRWLGRDRFEPCVSHLLEGFYSIIPKSFLAFLRPEELQMLLSGQLTIEIKDIRDSAQYMGGYDKNSPQIVWFWQFCEEADQETLGNVISFVTGCRSIPLDGLDPSFTIALSMDTAEDTSREDNSKIGILPRAHTCFNQLVLPPYTSSSQLAEQIQLAISFGSEGFFMH